MVLYSTKNSTNRFTCPVKTLKRKALLMSAPGCEDPRITRIENEIHMCYTAWDGRSEPRVALTSITANDFLARRWNWAKPVIISPPGIMDKNAAIFPRKFGNKFAILHRPGVSIWLDMVDNLAALGNGNWIKGSVIMSPIQEELPAEKIGIAAPPIETEYGWLLIYHVVAHKEGHRIYYLSAALLDSERPSRVIARRKTPLLEPEMLYEREGQVPNVVFSCGAVVINGNLFVYYGGADKVIGVATIELSTAPGRPDAAKRDWNEMKQLPDCFWQGG